MGDGRSGNSVCKAVSQCTYGLSSIPTKFAGPSGCLFAARRVLGHGFPPHLNPAVESTARTSRTDTGSNES